jgi:cytochrome c5
MSDAPIEHQSGIKTPKQLIATVIAGFLVPIVVIGLLVEFASNSQKVGVGSEAQTPAAIEARIQPVADQGFTLKDASAPKQLQSGEQVFKAVCFACHATGAAGAPKLGDAAAWSARIAAGYDALLGHALHGLNAMPAKGGNPDLDDVEVARAVVYMANQAGAKFKEPQAPAAPATAAPAAAAATTAAAAAPAPVKVASADAGKKLYDSVCMACHSAGVAGAPKFGDKAAWADRIKQGVATLDQHAINGFQGKTGTMPPKGGSQASDEDVKAAVAYMMAAAK